MYDDLNDLNDLCPSEETRSNIAKLAKSNGMGPQPKMNDSGIDATITDVHCALARLRGHATITDDAKSRIHRACVDAGATVAEELPKPEWVAWEFDANTGPSDARSRRLHPKSPKQKYIIRRGTAMTLSNRGTYEKWILQSAKIFCAQGLVIQSPSVRFSASGLDFTPSMHATANIVSSDGNDRNDDIDA